MTEKKPKRLVGRIDRVFYNRENERWGILVTEDWTEYVWHSRDSQDGKKLEQWNIVAFDPEPAQGTDEKPRAVNITLVKRNESGEHFGKLARFVRQRSEEVA